MHHSIWVEHDGSWTWSIEEGKAFEDGHEVLARDDSFPTRGDAKEDMQKAWAKLIEEGKKPGRPGQRKTPASKSITPAHKSPAARKSENKESVSPTLPEWAVIVEGAIVALFASKTTAQQFAKDQYSTSHSLKKIGFGAVIK